MGAHSTVLITRSAAKRFVMGELFSISDETLERIVDDFLDSRLYNCRIVNDDNKESEDYLLDL